MFCTLGISPARNKSMLFARKNTNKGKKRRKIPSKERERQRGLEIKS
jgi:hypothetical protein